MLRSKVKVRLRRRFINENTETTSSVTMKRLTEGNLLALFIFLDKLESKSNVSVNHLGWLITLIGSIEYKPL